MNADGLDEAEVRERIAAARCLAVLTGAGVSAESGVPTFRDAQTGLWARFRPEELATPEAFRARPAFVWDWYLHRRRSLADVKSNAAHEALADWARRHPGRMTLITQNVDGLHQRAGSTGVLALHGDLMRDQWLEPPRDCCDDGELDAGPPPRCPHCGNLRRPAVVWFGEMLPVDALEAAQRAAQRCQVMLVVGTSGAVHPAAGLAITARRSGAFVVVVNPDQTELDAVADLCLRGSAATLLPRLLSD